MPNSVASNSSNGNSDSGAAVPIDWDEWLRMDPEHGWKRASLEVSEVDNLISRTSNRLTIMQGKAVESLKQERKAQMDEYATDVELEKLEAAIVEETKTDTDTPKN